jgi:hypothetical protein
LRLFESLPKGLRLRPGKRYQEAAYREPEAAVAEYARQTSDPDLP